MRAQHGQSLTCGGEDGDAGVAEEEIQAGDGRGGLFLFRKRET